jgi:hypothetical protein
VASSLGVSTKNPICSSNFSHVCYISHTS